MRPGDPVFEVLRHRRRQPQGATMRAEDVVTLALMLSLELRDVLPLLREEDAECLLQARSCVECNVRHVIARYAVSASLEQAEYVKFVKNEHPNHRPLLFEL